MLELTAARRAPLERLISAWLAQRDANGERTPAPAPAGEERDDGRNEPVSDDGHRIEVREVEVIRTGRPLLFDVLADIDGRAAHALLGVRSEDGSSPSRGPGVEPAGSTGGMIEPGSMEGMIEPGSTEPSLGRHASSRSGANGAGPGRHAAIASPDEGAAGGSPQSASASPAGSVPAPEGLATLGPIVVSEEGGLGFIQDEQGMGVVVDALRDSDLARLALEAVTGQSTGREAVSTVNDTDEGIVLDFAGRCTFTVFPWLVDGPHRGVEMLLALDDAGFNHLAAPIAVWRRGGHDLGVVQEQLLGSAGGWALALTSLRDLYGSGGRPEEAGGDFGPEAQALGTMTARMHLALERAFGKVVTNASEWVDHMEASVGLANPSLLAGAEVTTAVEGVRASGLRAPALRTHGDFHLGRTARTDVGWVVADWSPGGCPPGASAPVFRSPLADVADMLWSIHHVSTVATAERDPTGRDEPTRLSRSWAARNRNAFLMAYLAAPGISAIVPSDRALVRHLVTVFELERAAGGQTT
jgi:hypothetical protein